MASACISWQKSKLGVRGQKDRVELGSQNRWTFPKYLTGRRRKREMRSLWQRRLVQFSKNIFFFAFFAYVNLICLFCIIVYLFNWVCVPSLILRPEEKSKLPKTISMHQIFINNSTMCHHPIQKFEIHVRTTLISFSHNI